MSTGFKMGFGDKYTVVGTTQLHPLGQKRLENVSGYVKEFTYVKAGGTIAANAQCETDHANDLYGGQVLEGGAAGDLAGVNESGGIRSSGDYFWLTTRGPASALVVTGVSAAAILAPAASGALDAGAAGSVQHLRCKAMEANSSGGTLAKQVLLY